MSNRAVKVQSFDAKDPFAGLALVTKPVPKAEAGHVVVQITLRPVNPIDLNHIRYGSNGFFTPGAVGFGIVHDVSLSILLFYFHAIRFGIRKSPCFF
jgi:NADPH:quinone reductase-like Zn-dependent oxidoreductase